MSVNYLSDEIINLVSKLDKINKQKEKIRQRIKQYEEKLDMIRQANSSITKDEQDIIKQLQLHGLNYGSKNLNMLEKREPEINPQPEFMNVQTQDQLAELLKHLFKQQPMANSNAIPVNSTPTSVLNSPIPQRRMSENRTHESDSIKMSPTSAPGLSIRTSTRR